MSLVMMMNMDLKIQGKICLIDLGFPLFSLLFHSNHTFFDHSIQWLIVQDYKRCFFLIGSIQFFSSSSPSPPSRSFFFFAVICDVVSSFFLISVSSMLLFSNMRTPKVTLACLSFLWSPGLSPSLSFRFPFFLVSESCFSWYLKLLYLLFCLFERRSALSFWFEFETFPPIRSYYYHLAYLLFLSFLHVILFLFVVLLGFSLA